MTRSPRRTVAAVLIVCMSAGLPFASAQTVLPNDAKFIRKNGGSQGFEVVPEGKLPQVGRYRGKPFPEAVILRHTGREATIHLPALVENQYLGMAVGIQYDMKKLKHGPLGDLEMAWHTIAPVLNPDTRSFDLVEKVVGGFTLQVHATDPHVGPKGRVEYPD